jgi:hypothetical protein
MGAPQIMILHCDERALKSFFAFASGTLLRSKNSSSFLSFVYFLCFIVFEIFKDLMNLLCVQTLLGILSNFTISQEYP